MKKRLDVSTKTSGRFDQNALTFYLKRLDVFGVPFSGLSDHPGFLREYNGNKADKIKICVTKAWNPSWIHLCAAKHVLISENTPFLPMFIVIFVNQL